MGQLLRNLWNPRRAKAPRRSRSRPLSAPVLLALPGYPDNARIFDRLAQALPRYRVIAVEWPLTRHGPTDRAAWLCSLLDERGIERAQVFGHDMGALPALCLARSHPERVDRVFVCNALLSNTAPTSLAIRFMRASKAYRVVLPRFGGRVFQHCMSTFLDEPLDAALSAEMRAAFLRPPALRATVAMCRAYDDELPDALRTFSSIRVPVHAGWGTREAHFTIAHAHALAAAVPGATVTEIDGAHWMVHERASIVAEWIERSA